METAEKQYLSVMDVARHLNVSKQTVYRLIASGQLFAIRTSAHTTRIPKPSLEEHLRQIDD